jgi:hypothetical protein
MRSRRDDVDHALAVERALDLGLCGVGGILPRTPRALGEALALTEETYDERTARRLERFAAAPEGAFVWTRDGDGLFWLGRITGEWHYDPDDRAVEADLVHVRSCAWARHPVATDAVPAAVSATFARGGRNFQQTHHQDVAAESEKVWRRAHVDG